MNGWGIPPEGHVRNLSILPTPLRVFPWITACSDRWDNSVVITGEDEHRHRQICEAFGIIDWIPCDGELVERFVPVVSLEGSPIPLIHLRVDPGGIMPCHPDGVISHITGDLVRTSKGARFRICGEAMRDTAH